MTTAAFDEIADNFDFLDDWEDRYRYVIELGKDMSPLDDTQKVPATKVEGCASQVWLVPQVDGQGPEAILTFKGDSDALIVRGLIAVLRALFNGKTAREVSETDAIKAMAGLGLDRHLSAQRSNGLRAMIARIHAIAEQTQGHAA